MGDQKWALSPRAIEQEKITFYKEEGTAPYEFNSSAGFWYDLTLGGYFDPTEVLADPDQIEEVYKALNLLKSLERDVYDRLSVEF